MNPKQDNPPPTKKFFDVAPPGRTPASPSSRPVVGGRSVKDFDFADKPDISISKFRDDDIGSKFDEKPGAPELDFAGQSDESQKNRLDLDGAESSDDLSKIQSEFGSPERSESHGTDFKPDNYETSTPDSETDENAEDEPEPDESRERYDDSFNEDQPARQTESSQTKKEASRRSGSERQKVGKDSKPPVESSKEDQRGSKKDSVQNQPLVNTSTGQMVVSQHTGHGTLWAELFAFIIILILLAGILNLSLDAGLLTLEGVPHTDFFGEM